MPLVESFDGVPVGPGTPYDVCFADSVDYEWTQNLSLQQFINRTPRLQSRSPNAWSALMRVLPGDTAPGDMDQWRQDAIKVFNPHKGLRTMTAGFGALDLELTGTISRIAHPQGMPMDADARSMLLFQWFSPENAWRVIPSAYPSSSPLAVGGNYPALPAVIYTPAAGTLKRFRITYADNTGRGLKDHWVRSPTFDTTGLSITDETNFVAFQKGRVIPCYVRSPNSANTTVDVRVTIPQGGVADDCFVDLFCGADVANPEFTNATFERGGISLEDGDLAADEMVWNDMRFSIFPDADFSWRPVIHGQFPGNVGFEYREVGARLGKTDFTTEAEILWAPSQSASSPNNANAILVTLGREADTPNAFVFSYVLTADVGTATLYLDYWIAGAIVPQHIFIDGVTAGTVTGFDTAVECEDAVRMCLNLAVGATDPDVASGTLEFQMVAGTTINPWSCLLKAAAAPTVAVAAGVDACLIDGVVITNTTTGETITIDDVYMDEADLTIDCYTREITAPAGYYIATIDGGPVPSERDLWFPLLEDATNTLTVTGGGSVQCSWQDRLLI